MRREDGVIQRGDRVRLTRSAAEGYNNRMRPQPLDWCKRCGVVQRITCNKTEALVRWDGRRSDEQLSIRAIEGIEDVPDR